MSSAATLLRPKSDTCSQEQEHLATRGPQALGLLSCQATPGHALPLLSKVQGYSSTHLGNEPPSVLVIGSQQHIAACQILRRPEQGSGTAAGLQQGAGRQNMSKCGGCSACSCTSRPVSHTPRARCPGCADKPCQQQFRGRCSRWRPCLACHAQQTAPSSANPCPRHPAGGMPAVQAVCTAVMQTDVNHDAQQGGTEIKL